MNDNNSDTSDSIDCDPTDTLYELGLEMNETNGYPGDEWETVLPEEIRDVEIKLFGRNNARKQIEFMVNVSGKSVSGCPLELINYAIADVVDHEREGLNDYTFGGYTLEDGWTEDRPDGEAEAIAGQE